MPQVTGTGTTYNLPNYAGELFTASPTQTPFLSMIGGLSGGKQTDNFEFATGVVYERPDATQPSISERASIKAPDSQLIARSQETNVVQIHQETIDLSYAKMSNSGRLSGLNTAGQTANPNNEKAFQIQQKLIKIACDVEYSFLNGTYHKAETDAEANTTRGMLELCTSSAGTSIDAASTLLSKDLLNQLYREMAENGAVFNNMVLFCNAFQKQLLSDIYMNQFKGQTPATRNVGGYNITEIETDFFKMGICWNPFMPRDAILIADMAQIAPVFQPVPGKGNFFEEALAKEGASDKVQIYGQVGLAHAPAFLHGAVTGLTVA
ncbi:MAG: DUF5309 family protein [Lachnospiraceae bacterium]|nr:DUF5309 family protein [Lachnospiraceae bacterium]